MDNFEEALRNIDAFCRVLVNKMVENGSTSESNIAIEPMKKLPQTLARALMEDVEEPLIDIFEDDNYVKVLVQCRCKDQKVTVQPNIDSLEICKKECHGDAEHVEICTDRCQKLDLPGKNLQVENMTANCTKNTVFELKILKK